MILVDSSVLIDYFNGVDNPQVTVLDNALGKEIIVIGDYILLEVLQGFKSDKDFHQAQEVLSEFPTVQLCNQEIAIKSAANYRYLKKKGISIRKMIDVLIATFCIENDFVLLHRDRDFEPFEKYLHLKVVTSIN